MQIKYFFYTNITEKKKKKQWGRGGRKEKGLIM